MGDDLVAWNDVYDENSYVMLALVLDGESAKLKLKLKAEEEAWFWAAKQGKKYLFDFGLGDEEFDEKDVPNPIRKLIASQGGGPNGNAAKLPPKKLVIKGTLKRPYAEYASMWRSRGSRPDEYMSKALYDKVANMYLKAMGMPLYL